MTNPNDALDDELDGILNRLNDRVGTKAYEAAQTHSGYRIQAEFDEAKAKIEALIRDAVVEARKSEINKIRRMYIDHPSTFDGKDFNFRLDRIKELKNE